MAWGLLNGRRCAACTIWRHNKHRHQDGSCAGCGQEESLRKGYCRLCWSQARAEATTARAAGESRQKAIASNFLGQVGAFHQLFFAGMLINKGAATTPERRYDWRGAPRKPPSAPAHRPRDRWVQPKLFEVLRDFTQFNEDTDADPGNPWLVWGIFLAHQIGEAHGWRRGTQYGVRRGLIIVLSGHLTGDVVCYSELFPAMRALEISVERVAEVLTAMGVFSDDRSSSFENWLGRKLDGLTDGIRQPTEVWLRAMREGGPRTKPRGPATVWTHMGYVRPTLLDWSGRYDHLREVTRDDVLSALDELTGSRRSNLLVALRSLFAFAKKTGKIFRNPTRGIRVGQHPYGLAQRLDQDDVDRVTRAATTPAARLVLMLAAVHAARSGAIRALLLDDVDLGNRRLTIASRTRPIDEFSHQILLEWLDYRRTRWPNTANPHLLINQMSAHSTRPVSTIYFAKKLRGQAATLERLRVDRQLEEALTHGPDPLHLAAVFGLDPKTAIRYAENARVLLATTIEDQDPASRDEPKGPQPT
jgi:integrase